MPAVPVARLRRRALLRGVRDAAWPTSRPSTTLRCPAGPADRDEHDLGVIAGITDRGTRRHRNEDAFAIAAADGRFVAAVCDGVASTANPDQAARAAADTALAVLEPLLSAPDWPQDRKAGGTPRRGVR